MRIMFILLSYMFFFKLLLITWYLTFNHFSYRCWVSTDSSNNSTTSSNNKQSQQQQAAVSHVSLSSSSQLRVLLSVLYTMVETLRWPSPSDTNHQTRTREAFCADLVLVRMLDPQREGTLCRGVWSNPPYKERGSCMGKTVAWQIEKVILWKEC